MPGGRVLMIAHHFPPVGGSGSNRALAFARYLGEYGWQPTVLTPGSAWAANRDDRLLSELPPNVQVIRTASFEPRPSRSQAHRGANLSTPRPGHSRTTHGWDDGRIGVYAWRGGGGLRSQLAHLKRFPDAHMGWLPFALAAARGVEYDVAYSSSGPFTSHLVGLLLKRATGRAWVAELRDGWYCWNRAIFPDYPVWRDAVERRLESAAIRSADRVILVTDRMADAFRRQYPALPAKHFAVVSNGFDRAQFPPLTDQGTPPQPGSHPGTQAGFEVLHAGSLYYGRSLATFLEAATRLVQANPAFARQFRLKLVGTLDATARAELSRHSLGGRIQFSGQLDHSATLRAMRAANLLLLISNTTPGAEATVPGKLFEYLAVGRPVLAIAPPDSSTADVLASSGGGWLACAGDAGAIARTLEHAFEGHLAGQMPPPSEQMARFDRRALSSELARIFDQAVAGAAGRA